MGNVKGYAGSDTERQLHVEAWDRVKHIKGAILSDRSLYARRVKTLAPALIANLTDLERLVLADGGPSPFGGEVLGSTVTVYTD